jgi:hypothetical protein
MKISTNTILNEKYVLKAYLRQKQEKVTAWDINNDVVLGLGIPSAKILFKGSTQVRKIARKNNKYGWNLIVPHLKLPKNSHNFNANSMVGLIPTTTSFYGTKLYRKKLVLQGLKDVFKGKIYRRSLVRAAKSTNILKNIQDESLSTKLFFLHRLFENKGFNNRKFLNKEFCVFFKHKLSNIYAVHKRFFEYQKRRIKFKNFYSFSPLSKKTVFKAVTKSIKKINRRKFLKLNLRKFRNKLLKRQKIFGRGFNQTLGQTFNYLKDEKKNFKFKVKQNIVKKKITKIKLDKYLEKKEKILSLFERFNNLNENNKKFIKAAIESRNLQIFNKKIIGFGTRKTFQFKSSTKNTRKFRKQPNSKRRKYRKVQWKKYCKKDSRILFKRRQTKYIRGVYKFARLFRKSVDKGKQLEKSKILSKLSVKNSRSEQSKSFRIKKD